MNITVDQLESITRSTIVGWIVFFNIFGLFGNTNLIAITLHEKELQTKSGLLLASNAFAHNIILLSEFISVSYHLSDQPIYRKDCFHSIAHFIFCMCFQAVVIFMMSLDILFAILFPIKYRLIDQNFKYLLKCLLLPIIYSCTIIIVSFVYLNDNKIPFCNPPLAMPSEACRAWSVSNMVINTATLISYSIVIIVFKYKQDNTRQDSKKVIRRLSVIVIVFIFSWYICIVGVEMAAYLTGAWKALLQTLMIFFALVCYSQSFYVCIWRSREYRAAFRRFYLKMFGLNFSGGSTKASQTIHVSSAQASIKADL